jgi:hypothetical protein
VTAAPRQDLDVDLVVGAVDAGRVVDRVGVDRRRGAAYSIAPELGQPRLPPSPTTRHAQLGAVDADRVVALSPTSAWVSVDALT